MRTPGVRSVRLVMALGTLALVAGCDLARVTPFPGFLTYTDVSVDLSSEVQKLSKDTADTSFTLQVVHAAGDEPRVLLLVEPPADPEATFDYRGELWILNTDLERIGETRPGSDLDTFGPPLSYAHDGNLLVSNSILSPDGEPVERVTYQGFEGPAVVDPGPGSPRTYVFSLPPGEFAGFELVWEAYEGEASPNAPYTLPVSEPPRLAIIPEEERRGDGAADDTNSGYQVLDAVYNNASDQVTFLLSEPSARRVVAARASLSSIASGAVSSLVASPGEFSVSVPADRPLDARADRNGFFLRRRDGWLDRYSWTADGELKLLGEPVRVVGDRYFDRDYAFLSGPEVERAYMYRFDPSSRIITRYRKWW